MKSPHMLFIGTNPFKLHEHLGGVLDAANCQKILDAVQENAIQLYRLGEGHLEFAKKVQKAEWRQIVSRLYYAAYNMSRAVRYLSSGEYNRDSKDHKQVGELPSVFPNAAKYLNIFKSVRDDRNLADYDHTAEESELIVSVVDLLVLTAEFQKDVKDYFATKGVIL